MTSADSVQRGEVVWGLGPFKEHTEDESDPERPFLVLSNETHPFADRQFAGVALSTTLRAEAVVLDTDDWTAGGLPKQSYAYPWLLVTRDYADIASVYGRLRPSIVSTVLDHLIGYLSARDSDET